MSIQEMSKELGLGGSACSVNSFKDDEQWGVPLVILFAHHEDPFGGMGCLSLVLYQNFRERGISG